MKQVYIGYLDPTRKREWAVWVKTDLYNATVKLGSFEACANLFKSYVSKGYIPFSWVHEIQAHAEVHNVDVYLSNLREAEAKQVADQAVTAEAKPASVPTPAKPGPKQSARRPKVGDTLLYFKFDVPFISMAIVTCDVHPANGNVCAMVMPCQANPAITFVELPLYDADAGPYSYDRLEWPPDEQAERNAKIINQLHQLANSNKFIHSNDLFTILD